MTLTQYRKHIQSCLPSTVEESDNVEQFVQRPLFFLSKVTVREINHTTPYLMSSTPIEVDIPDPERIQTIAYLVFSPHICTVITPSPNPSPLPGVFLVTATFAPLSTKASQVPKKCKRRHHQRIDLPSRSWW